MLAARTVLRSTAVRCIYSHKDIQTEIQMKDTDEHAHSVRGAIQRVWLRQL